MIEDLDTTNGTWLKISNGREISEPYIIFNGDVLRIGGTVSI